MNYFKIFLGIFAVLAASRFIPHPPNFTSLLALSFYVPVFFGKRFIPAVIFSFAVTDLFIGFHNTLFFTWGSVILIGLLSRYFIFNSITSRIFGAISGAFIFFFITNFGVWTSGFYGYSLSGLISCYILAIPFFAQTLASTAFFSLVIEMIYNLLKTKTNILQVKN
tara:strand:+ start:3715 stop:4212 length:498 start_codon:yes stop_codon:yes gene_type:complete